MTINPSSSAPSAQVAFSIYCVVSLVVEGELDVATAGELDDAVTACLATRPAGVTIDMSGVEFMAAAGLSTLLACRARAARQGTRLTVVRPSTTVERTLRLAHLRSLLVEDADEASRPSTVRRPADPDVGCADPTSSMREQVRLLPCLPCGRDTHHTPGAVTQGKDGSVLVRWWCCTECDEGEALA